jgi:glutamate-ammonia-ligase adenylyltransferase
MREKMRESLNSETKQQFDVKRDPGGIVDIEFLVQFGVLSGARDHESLLLWTDVVRLLDSLAISGFLTVNDAHSLRTAYCAFREWTHRSALLDQPAVAASERYAGLRAEVSRIWRNIMGC